MNKEQMKNHTRRIIIGALAMIIGLGIVVQIKMTGGNYSGGLVPLAKVQALVSELNQVKEERDGATKELLEVEAKLKAIESEQATESDLINSLVADVEKYKMLAGTLDVIGSGVTITINDPVATTENFSESSVIMMNYELLLSLVNKLKDAGAEAISINDQRIISISEISLAGENVNINAKATAPPYVIKAIGNPDTLEAAISIRFGIVEKMKTTYDLKVEIEKGQEVLIPRYSKAVQFRYANPVTIESGL